MLIYAINTLGSPLARITESDSDSDNFIDPRNGNSLAAYPIKNTQTTSKMLSQAQISKNRQIKLSVGELVS